MICPICKKEFIGDIKNPNYPFCGSTCKNIDHYNWFEEKYVISNSIDMEEDYENQEN
jgi:endogenous inhibitor of DNA gyrase (YacG/DUF329 family)